MEQVGPGRTMTATAMFRGAHFLGEEPKILDDSFARVFVGFPSDEELLKGLN